MQTSQDFAEAGTAIPEGITQGDLYRAAWAASIGSALEYYDFALYNLASSIIFAPLFFPSSDPTVGLMASFGTYFLGFAIRPVGGVVFGILGDRLGRKFVLLATVLLMGVASTLIGVLPTYQSVGYWAPAMLIALRLLQGLGAGAEQAGAAVLMTEYAPPARRGYFAALPFMGIQLGSVAAAIIYFSLLYGITDVSQTWLWRVPFLLSVIIIAVAIWIRLKLKESPSFTKLEARHQVDAHPLAHLLAESKRTVLTVIGLRMAENGASSIYQSLALSYAVAVMGVAGSVGAISLACASLTGAIIIIATGLLSDKIGRVPVYKGFALYQIVMALPVWWLLSRGTEASTIAGVVLGLVSVWGMFATQGALLPELFGARHRYVGVALGREISAVFAGGIAPLLGASLISYLSANYGGKTGAAYAWLPLAGYVAVLSLISFVTTFYIPETRGRDLDDLRDSHEAPGA